ncbi:MAG TPA: hypothetical protein VNC39_00245 [Acidocella sp.]|uniref:hypothetical protein n=1 Tax=Acidocella sp. TaxID=50710 RepID=UPI002B9296A0|nr:hypothetical protein [Acidocella sp.]HVE20380.1 hypothetical protein [Acidocella sp.]
MRYPLIKGLALALCLAALPLAAYSQGTILVMGAGLSSCGTWIHDRAQGESSFSAQEDEEFVSGFVTGEEVLLANSKGVPYSINTDSAGVFDWVDNYCRANSAGSLYGAALAFVSDSGVVVPKTPVP